MQSIADSLRADGLTRDAALSPAERIVQALSLGDRDVLVFAQAQSISPAQARQRLALQRQLGRRPSPCHAAILE
jgi:hypothetical protein